MTLPLTPLLQKFASSLTRNFAAAVANPAEAEDQLKGPTQQLLEEAGGLIGLEVVARTEARTELGVRPDLGVSVDQLLVGHVELKAPGKGARASSYSDRHDREQFKKLADHPNLLYTDGNEWALYRQGRPTGSIVSSAQDVRSAGADAFNDEAAARLERLLADFFQWAPIVPSSPRALAELLAPLTRLLREQVVTALVDPTSALSALAGEWRDFFFPDADDARFADAYAQTLAYALLLARVEGETDLHARAAQTLERKHGLLAQVLRWLEEPSARREVEAAVGLLERVIAAVDPEKLTRDRQERDLWLYFYEDFLAAYDPKLRKQTGVYYTPPEVVLAQTTLVAELLESAFGKELAFADDGVTVLDPAVGTGTYLIGAIEAGLERVRARYGDGGLPGRATEMGRNFHGFELLIGPYAVAHLRVSQRIIDAGGDLPDEGAHVYLTDTLSSPNLAPPGIAHAPLFHRKLAQENERARRVKSETPILVCIGNPPYFREVRELGDEAERLGGWVRRGDDGDGILGDFLRDAPPVHAKNLYNLYVYFWRWALWKVFESGPGRGIVSFISASSYLRGPGFAGMRRFMREVFDDLWILDLGGEGRGARRSENVFDIQTPVAIAVGVRYDEPKPGTPARVRYAAIEGSRQEKYDALRAIKGAADVPWEDCFRGWTEPFLPERAGDFFAWPLFTDVFPWQHSGVQFKRTWPIAPDRGTLEERWRVLVSASPDERRELFRETRDRKVDRVYPTLVGEQREPPIAEVEADARAPTAVPYAYRTLDRQFALADARLGDFLRPVLWQTAGARQLFLTTLLADDLGEGPAAFTTALAPDMHHFSGRGGKDVVPLWRDAAGEEPNVTEGLLEKYAATLGTDVAPEELFAYCYAVLSAPSYTTRFVAELEVPGPRVPLTVDSELFKTAVELGERLVWLHTYGARFVPPGYRAGQVPQGAARCTVAVAGTPEAYPTEHSYDPSTARLHVGSGQFEPVAPGVRGFAVSGLDVIGSWLDYRMREGAGRRSSPLDRIRPQIWTAVFTEDLLRLLWVVEHTVALGPDLDDLLDRIVGRDLVPAKDLPEPSDAEREAPATPRA